MKRLLKLGNSRGARAAFAILFVYLAVTFVQVWIASRRDDARPSQAIIVLGAAQYDGTPSTMLAARLDHAIDLYRAHIAPVIVVTGGKQPGDQYTEAGASADYLHEHDVPDQRDPARRRPVARRGSRSKRRRGFSKSRGMIRVVLVSDPYHSERIEDDRARRRSRRGDLADAHESDQGIRGIETHVAAKRCGSPRAASSGTRASTGTVTITKLVPGSR